MVLSAKCEAKYKLDIAPNPTSDHVDFVLGLENRRGVKLATFIFPMNGARCPVIDDMKYPSQFPEISRATRFACPLSEVQSGYNEFYVVQDEGQPAVRRV